MQNQCLSPELSRTPDRELVVLSFSGMAFLEACGRLTVENIRHCQVGEYQFLIREEDRARLRGIPCAEGGGSRCEQCSRNLPMREPAVA